MDAGCPRPRWLALFGVEGLFIESLFFLQGDSIVIISAYYYGLNNIYTYKLSQK